MLSKLIIFLFLAYFLFFSTSSFAVTLLVPNTFLSIQEAIDAANPGDIIMVGSGVYRLYYGNIFVNKDSLTIKSAHGAQKTTIEGKKPGPVITIGEGHKATIDGFTIRGSKGGEDVAIKGGGIYCAPSSSPAILNNIITDNNAIFGGGIYCDELSFPKISNNVIIKNHADSFGGGILTFRSSPKISGNRLEANDAKNSGGALFCNRNSPFISNNIIWNNTAKYGGGISLERTTATILNNTITNNTATYGGGILLAGGINKMINLILWDNTDDIYAEELNSSARPDHSNIKDGDFRGLNGNLSTDPLFLAPQKGDFRLHSDSPCKNAGNKDPIYKDLDGSRNDIGGYGGPEPYLGTAGNN